jgi:hypothetical protein
MPPTNSARPISPPMLAKTIPITRLAVQFDRGRAALAAVFEVGRCSPPSVMRPSLRGARADAWLRKKRQILRTRRPTGLEPGNSPSSPLVRQAAMHGST